MRSTARYTATLASAIGSKPTSLTAALFSNCWHRVRVDSSVGRLVSTIIDVALGEIRKMEIAKRIPAMSRLVAAGLELVSQYSLQSIETRRIEVMAGCQRLISRALQSE